MHLHVTCFMFLLCPMFTSPHPLRRRVGKQTSAAPELQLLEDLLGSVMSHNCLDTCLFRHLWRVHSITTNQIQAFSWTSSPVLAHFWPLFSACHSQGFGCRAARQRQMRWTMTRQNVDRQPWDVRENRQYLGPQTQGLRRRERRLFLNIVPLENTASLTRHLTPWHSPQTPRTSQTQTTRGKTLLFCHTSLHQKFPAPWSSKWTEKSQKPWNRAPRLTIFLTTVPQMAENAVHKWG